MWVWLLVQQAEVQDHTFVHVCKLDRNQDFSRKANVIVVSDLFSKENTRQVIYRASVYAVAEKKEIKLNSRLHFNNILAQHIDF